MKKLLDTFVRTKAYRRIEITSTTLSLLFGVIMLGVLFYYLERSIAQGLGELNQSGAFVLKIYLWVSFLVDAVLVISFWMVRYLLVATTYTEREVPRRFFFLYRLFCAFTLVKVCLSLVFTFRTGGGSDYLVLAMLMVFLTHTFILNNKTQRLAEEKARTGLA